MDESKRFHEAFMLSEIKAPVSHASYLINLSGGESVRGKSIEALVREVERCDLLGIPSIVLHPGSYGDVGSKEEGIAIVAESLHTVFNETANLAPTILLETMAGQGSALGSTLEELAEIARLLDATSRLGFCIDFCHVFASGYNISTRDGYFKFFDQVEKHLRCERIGCFHLSDSKMPLGARRDRHEHLGEGAIGITPFSLLMTDQRFQEVPAILETPKEGFGDKGNLALLRKFRGY